MKMKSVLVLGLCLTLLTGVWVLKTQAAEKEVVDAVSKLAGDVSGGKDAKAIQAAAMKIAKGPADQDVYLVMEIFSKRKSTGKGGVGIGDKIGAITPDGIEAKLINMARRVSDDDVGKDSKALQEAMMKTAAAAAATAHLAPSKVQKNKSDMAKWQNFSKSMYDGSLALAKALKSGDKKASKAAAKTLNNSCVGCHNDFR